MAGLAGLAGSLTGKDGMGCVVELVDMLGMVAKVGMARMGNMNRLILMVFLTVAGLGRRGALRSGGDPLFEILMSMDRYISGVMSRARFEGIAHSDAIGRCRTYADNNFEICLVRSFKMK